MTHAVIGKLPCRNGVPLLEKPDASLSFHADPQGRCVFAEFSLSEPLELAAVRIGPPVRMRRFVAWHRYEPFWMKPAFGTDAKEIPKETQGLLFERDDGLHVLLVPLFNGAFRCALEGLPDGELQIVADTGDAWSPGSGGLAFLAAAGEDPFEMLPRAAEALRCRLPDARLRREKPAPDFVDLFGWCTWDAFYHDVTPDKVVEGLESFKRAGVQPRWLILDDGWQSVKQKKLDVGSESRLASFKPNEKFGGALRPLVEKAKSEYGVRRFIVWHALTGYWAGVDTAAFAAYGAVDATRQYGRDIMIATKWAINYLVWGHLCGLVPASGIASFLDDYHAYLASEGVDGVKVDVQAQLESLSQGQGGRVPLTRAYRQALESSVARHFAGRLINCMSHATETFYLCPESNVLRGSTDFWPKDHFSYCGHLLANAHTGLWFGEWTLVDWDMFHSRHPHAAYNAAGRAVSGGPVYVSDKPGAHDAALLRKLVCADGAALRSDGPARPTRDAIYRDPATERKPLKLFNRSGDAAVVAFFHPRCALKDGERPFPVRDTLSIADIPGLADAPHALLRHTTGTASRLEPGKSAAVRLAPGGWEILTLAPIADGLAVLGLADKFNSPAAVSAVRRPAPGVVEIDLRDGGSLALWTSRKVVSAAMADDGAPISVSRKGRAVRVAAPRKGTVRVTLA